VTVTTIVTPARVAAALERVIDPELGIDLVDLGLVYAVEVDDGWVRVDLGVTTPSCPFSRQLVEDAEAAVLSMPGVTDADVALCFEPSWSPDMLSDRGRRRLAGTHGICGDRPAEPAAALPSPRFRDPLGP
jgi:metal-sulfur cluster biosynthetic enzyme